MQLSNCFLTVPLPCLYSPAYCTAQTFILSISGVAFTGGFGTYLTGMSYQTYSKFGSQQGRLSTCAGLVVTVLTVIYSNLWGRSLCTWQHVASPLPGHTLLTLQRKAFVAERTDSMGCLIPSILAQRLHTALPCLFILVPALFTPPPAVNLNRDGMGLNNTAPTPPNTYYDPEVSRTIPYLLMTAVLGVFMLTQMRKLMIIDWKLPFPSGTASGIMMASFHTAVSAALAELHCDMQISCDID